MPPCLFGVIGWKNSGKTTLLARLIEEFTARGLTVSAIKHAHHSFEIDHEGRDSHRFRQSGARRIAVVSRHRWAMVHELRNEPEPSLQELLQHIGPCELVLIEGYKSGEFPKIEARSNSSHTSDPLAPIDPYIVAIAKHCDIAADNENLPVFDLDDIPAIADFIASHLGRDDFLSKIDEACEETG